MMLGQRSPTDGYGTLLETCGTVPTWPGMCGKQLSAVLSAADSAHPIEDRRSAPKVAQALLGGAAKQCNQS